MRLNEKTKDGILKAFLEISEIPLSSQLYLFGSRVDSQKMGGDIDLLLLVPLVFLGDLQSQKHVLVAKLKKYIDDQRLDLTLIAIENSEQDSFYLSIKSTLVRLN